MQHVQVFSAQEADKRQLRNLLGQFATGVTVVTTVGQDNRQVGMTANSFTSVSLEPPLILWNIAKSATNVDDFCQSQHFAINILNEQQHHTSNHFAKSAENKFAQLDQVGEVLGVPVLTDALAVLVCKTHQLIEAGDHYIIIGQIEQCQHNTGRPLLFHNGKYHQAELHPVHLEQCA